MIVTGAAHDVRALGGDDLVCVAGLPNRVSVRVDAGPGNDVVDTVAATTPVRTELGSGADTLHGGPTSDDVNTSGYISETGQQIPDTERDVVDTGAGLDRVASNSDGAVNPDVITTGPDSDYLYVEGPLAADGRLDGGHGWRSPRDQGSTPGHWSWTPRPARPPSTAGTGCGGPTSAHWASSWIGST
ncbi:hypothetical protein [Nocardioides sp. B-3]|uniref:hypothetical protein n=1 Tax=Nocardioides sp. B-3 TaxID=2895565 RepID=UPI00215274E3|nr:hypothetical protein [Nocardioides sp. B-3]UUZ60861.1 hypothetical protein LP418_09075 [Nocardioides sp. B-3]